MVTAFDLTKFLAELSATSSGETLPDYAFVVETGGKYAEVGVAFYDMYHTCRFEEALISVGKGV